MKRVTYLLFIVFFFSIVFGANLKIGGISLRNIVTALSIIPLLFQFTKSRMDKPILLYLLYIGSFLIASVLSSQTGNYFIYQSIYVWHLPGIILYIIGSSFVKDKKSLHIVSSILLVFVSINVLLSIFQYAKMDWAWAISNAINSHSEELYSRYVENDVFSDDLIGKSMINGITASVVNNGYFLTTFLPLSLLCFYSNKRSLFLKWYGIIFLLLSLVASYVIQQRMCFYIVLLFESFLLFKKAKPLGRIFIVFFVVFAIISFEYLFVDLDLGRLNELEDSGRERMYRESFPFIFNNSGVFWHGGLKEYISYFGIVPHNTLVGAWVYCGIAGFVIYCALLFYIIKDCINTIKKNQMACNPYAIAFSICCILYILYSMTHSAGIHNGAVYFWIMYGLMKKSNRVLNHNIKELRIT